MKKIGIIGSGEVGKALATGFLKHGFDVMLSSRSPEKIAEMKKNLGAKTGSMVQAAEFGELLVLAVKGKAAISAVESAGAKNFENKTVIDVTNPIDDSSQPQNGVLKFFTNLDESLMEQLQKKFPKTNFVKAFNSIGSPFMVNPKFSETPTMFYCGNNENAKTEVKKILEKFGFEPIDMGKVEAARAIEPLCILWCIPGFLRNEWSHAFRLVKK